MGDTQAMTMRGKSVAATRRRGGSGWPVRAGLLMCVVLGLAACELEEPGAYSFGYGSAAPIPERWQPGHATAYNTAILADNPRDLDRPRREAPRDSMRRDAVISSYRAEGIAEVHGTSTRNSGGPQ